jgi:hypothetical protein
MSIHWGGRGAGHVSRWSLATTGAPALSLNFLYGTLDPRITFSRGSNATLVDATGKITYAPANMLLRSQEFDNAAWQKSNATITANATAAPDGTTTADKFVPNAGQTLSDTRQQVTLSGNSTLTIYAKAAGYRYFYINSLGRTPTANNGQVFFDLQNGVVTAASAGFTGVIQSVGDGWFRCIMLGTSHTSAQTEFRVSATNLPSSVTMSPPANGTDGVFIWGAQLEPVTYQTTPSPYVATTASAYYGPRFDYDPVTLAPKGLLIEEARTNLLVQSENFATTWSGPPITGTLTANATASPAGTGNATLFAPSNTAVNHDIAQTVTAAAVSYTLSVYAKAQLYSHLFLQYFDGTTDRLAYFNLSTGAIGTTSGSPSPTITAVGNGWYRCTTTFTGVVGRNSFVVGAAPSDGGRAVAGNGTSGIYIWGAQLEQATFATSYIPTVASTVTRSADVATMTGTDFSSWYNANEGTFVAAYEASPNTFTTYLAASNGVVAQNSMHMDNDGAGNMRVAYYSGSSAVALLSLGAIGTIGTVNRIATAYKVNDFAASRNGGAVATDTAGAVPASVNRLNIGADPSGAAVNVSNIHIQKISYYNTRLLNTQLQTLTQ